MSANTPQNYKTLGQAPLDAKLVFTNIAAFNKLRQQNPAYAFDFYKGMKVYFQEEEKMYIWENPFSDNYKENHKILNENFIYPIGSAYEDLVYEFKAFNLIELPYRIENLGVWDVDDGDLTLDIDIYEGSTANPFVISDVTSLWPDVDRIAFIGGDITGLKLAGQPIALFQEFSINDWDDLSYDIWNNTDGFVQNAKIKIIKEGEVVDYTQYLNKITGNAFKEAGIVHSISDMLHKNSIYFKPTGNTFEIHVVDRLNIRRFFVSQQQGINDLTLAFSNFNLQILDSNNQVITQIPINISNINQLENQLNLKLEKPLEIVSLPNEIYKNFLLVDENKKTAEVTYNTVLSNILEYVLNNFPNIDTVSIINQDQTLRIDDNGNNNFILNSNISFFEEEFNAASLPNHICILNFTPTNIANVFNNGVRLNSDEFEIILPNKIKIISSGFDIDKVIINYYHKIN